MGVLLGIFISKNYTTNRLFIHNSEIDIYRTLMQFISYDLHPA